VKTSERLPLELAEEYTGPYFSTAEDVIEAAKSILVVEFSKDPTIRQEGRKWVESAAIISVTPTERGMTVIDKYHLYWVSRTTAYLRAWLIRRRSSS
jgi:transcription elongation factor SPT6